MNILALNPGSGTLLYKLLNMPEAAGPNDGIVLKSGTFDHVHGNEIAAAAEQAVADCLSLGIDAIGYLEPAAATGDKRAELALAIQAYRVRKYIGAYAAALGGMDAIALSGALAENSAALRTRVLDGLEFLGVRLDPGRNRAAGPDEPVRISADDSAVPVWVVPADEQRQIAREVADLLGVTGQDRSGRESRPKMVSESPCI
jgi:acetate kinase